MVLLYHATRAEYGVSISQHGVLSSQRGRLGPGVYLTTKAAAENIAKFRSASWWIVEVEVDLGRVYTQPGETNNHAGTWQGTHDTCTGMHPPWAGNGSFQEWCVKDHTRLHIKAVLQNGDNVTHHGNIHLPGATITVQGNARFAGSITCDTLVIGGGTVTLG